MEMLSIEDVRGKKPSEMHGDLHVTPEGFYFLGFKKINSWLLAIQVNFGLLGMWLVHRSEKKRKVEMEEWRAGHAGRYLDELVGESEGSWVVLQEEIRIVKPRFVSPGVVIEHKDGRKLSVETNKKQLKQIQEFARQHNWPVK